MKRTRGCQPGNRNALKHGFYSRVLSQQDFLALQQADSLEGFNFLSFINSGRLKLFLADNSSEYSSVDRELQLARAVYRPNQTMNFFVEPYEGHDDFLMSLALCVYVAADFQPREARGSPHRAS